MTTELVCLVGDDRPARRVHVAAGVVQIEVPKSASHDAAERELQGAINTPVTDVALACAHDLTPIVLRNLEALGLTHLVAIGGDDTLSYAARLGREGIPLVAIPKTMDNDVWGTEY